MSSGKGVRIAGSDGADELVFLPLGGSNEIGMNLNLYGFGPEHDRQWLMVDLGVTFGDERTPGIDLIMADPEFILEYTDNLLGLVLTHGHEDHIGAIAHIWPMLGCPIYATPFTNVLIEGKFRDIGLPVPDINVMPLGAQFSIGPFGLEYVTLTHSIPEPNGLAIETDLGTVLHTGDWKIDPDPLLGEVTDAARLKRLGEDGVLAMVCDSTNVFSPGTAGSEADVRSSLLELVKELKERVVVTCFASNVSRLETAAYVAAQTDRHLCLVGRSMHRMIAAAREVGLLKELGAVIDEEDAGFLPRDKVMYLCTGSQGEPRAALARIASGSHPNVTLDAGDTVVFSSRIIPGNEVSIFELQNELAAQDIDIITEKDHFVHVSGHPCRDELATMYQWVKPRIAVPVHGEIRHLHEHANLCKHLQVPETVVPANGTVVRLAPGPAQIIDEVPVGRIYLDGNALVHEEENHLRGRRKIAFSGYINVALVLDGAGRLRDDPVAHIHGIPDHLMDDDRILPEIVEDTIAELIDKLPKKQKLDEANLEQQIRRTIRKLLADDWGKKPVIDVSILSSGS